MEKPRHMEVDNLPKVCQQAGGDLNRGKVPVELPLFQPRPVHWETNRHK
jgi:hypothetical protein